MVRAKGVLLRSQSKNIGCPCCNVFRGVFGIDYSINYCKKIDDGT